RDRREPPARPAVPGPEESGRGSGQGTYRLLLPDEARVRGAPAAEPRAGHRGDARDLYPARPRQGEPGARLFLPRRGRATPRRGDALPRGLAPVAVRIRRQPEQLPEE